ncbi:MAG: cupin domain-containing protein [Kiritimatiellia bacterium]|jgi:mannose-6-phosphate isomerase-like protein (cupin superfamily)|nr:cupin domain-containing protein [Kiritimatiellia bacterium]
MITRDQEREVERRENMRGGTGTVQVEHWFRPEAFGAKARLCARLVIPPGGSIGTHRHEAEDEIYLVLSGQGLILENGRAIPVAAGDAVLTGKGGEHGVENPGAAPLVLAAVILPYA